MAKLRTILRDGADENRHFNDRKAGEEIMNKTPMTLWQSCLMVVLLVAGAVTSAFAVPPSQVLKVTTELPAFSGPCCFSFDETVAVTEPLTPVAVVVNWSASAGASFEDEFIGLMVNGGPCRFYGSGSFPAQGSVFAAYTFQWIVFPSDGLTAGTNTFTLCGGGGGIYAQDARFNVLTNILAARISN